MQLPVEYLARMKDDLGEEQYLRYIAAMDEGGVRGLRVNTLKAPIDFEPPFSVEKLTHVPRGYRLTSEVQRIGYHPLHMAGYFYMQEPSAMRVANLLDAKPGHRVLDLCAAPGGKAGQIAAHLQGEGILIANEVVPKRAKLLAHTLERLGARNSAVTVMRPEELCEHLPEWFDRVLVDAPCSGEGMFRKDESAIAEWSEGHVRTCAKRQALILESAASLVKPGGKLVYSTCTFSRAENEDNVDIFLEKNKNFTLEAMHRLWPHDDEGEGHFMAAFIKNDSDEMHHGRSHRDGAKSKKRGGAKKPPVCQDYSRFCSQAMRTPPELTPYQLRDGRLMLLPTGLPDGWQRLRLASGAVHAGDVKDGRFTPAHGLYMAYPMSEFTNVVRLNDDELSAFIRGEDIGKECSGGYAAISGEDMCWPVGFAKCANSIIKSRLPKGLRSN